jgi:hypothetical protein
MATLDELGGEYGVVDDVPPPDEAGLQGRNEIRDVCLQSCGEHLGGDLRGGVLEVGAVF